MDNENNVTASNYMKIRKANRLLLDKSEMFSESNIMKAKSIYKHIVSLGENDTSVGTVTARKMLRLLEVLEHFLPGAHLNNKADIHNVADVLYYNRFYFNDCYKDLLADLEEAAFYWCDKAAALGSPGAYLKRARLFLYGCGVKQSPEEAYNSYKKASEGSKDAWIIWTAVKNNQESPRADLADEVNAIKAFLYSEGLHKYEKDYDKAEAVIQNLSDITIAKSLRLLLANKVKSDKERIINESILNRSKECEDLNKNLSDINKQIKEAKELNKKISLELDNKRNDIRYAQNLLEEVNETIADKKQNIFDLNEKLENMEEKKKALAASYEKKKQQAASLDGQISELDLEYQRIARDYSEIEEKYADLKKYEETERINFNKCKMAAEQGNPKAQYELAEYYLLGKGTDKDNSMVVYWYEKSAEQGYTEAQYALANYCYCGKDDPKAFSLFKKAAEKGHLKAQYELAYCYQYGVGVEINNNQAYFWYKKVAEKDYKDSRNKLVDLELLLKEQDILYFNKQKEAAENGDLKSRYELANCYYHGRGVAKDVARAAYWYKTAAEQGEAKAQCELAFCYETGSGVLRNEHLAAYWYEKAARQGIAKAQYGLGRCYLNGKGVTKNEYDAVYWFKKVKDHNLKEAAEIEISNIVIRKRNETDNEVEVENCATLPDQHDKADKQAAVGIKGVPGFKSPDNKNKNNDDDLDSKNEDEKYYVKCKENAENNDASAQFALAVCYATGKGVFQNGHLAFYWFGKAAMQGAAKAQYELGKYYENGFIVTKNDYDAYYWYRKAAENGDAEAQYKLWLNFGDNNNMQVDSGQSFEWLKMSAAHGYVPAQLTLGEYYVKGLGTERDLEKAISCFKDAAAQGNDEALYNLVMCWENNNETDFNSEEALYYYKKASAKGQEQVKERILSVYQKYNKQENYIEWLKFAAELGDDKAQYQLGIKYYTGNGITRNKKQACEWFSKAASKGNEEAKRTLNNGSIFEDSYFDKLIAKAEQGDPEAQYEVAVSYETGLTKNKEKIGATASQAFHWYQTAAENGHAKAQFKLGRCYEKEKGTNKDQEKAIYWYKKAKEQGIDEAGAFLENLLLEIEADKGNPEAQYKVAVLYFSGRKGEKNLYKAFMYFKKAAKQGHIKAQYMTGRFYEEGWSTAQDFSEAINWYKKAAEQGDLEADQRVKKIQEQFEQDSLNIKKQFERLKKTAEEKGIDVDKHFEQIKKGAEQVKKAAEKNGIDVDKHIEQIEKVAAQGNQEIKKRYEQLKDKAAEEDIDIDKGVKQVKKWFRKIFE